MATKLSSVLPRTKVDPIVNMIIDKNERFIRRHIVLSPSVISSLAEAGVISGANKAEMRMQSNDEQVTLLLGILRSRSMDNFKLFLQILRDSLYGWLVDGILDTPMHQSQLLDNMLQYKTFREYLSKNSESYAIADNISRSFVKIDSPTNTVLVRHPPNASRYPLAKYPPVGYDYNMTSFPGNMFSLHSDFQSQRVETEHTLSMLRQEERAIKDLLYQNSREQEHLYQNQRVLHDIDRRLRQIQSDAGQLMQPSPNVEHARERLYRLQRVPWEGR